MLPEWVIRKNRMKEDARVLIIDDRRSEVWFIERVLRNMDVFVVTAFDGVERLAKINEAVPKWIILDTVMPRMDGYTFFHRLSAVQKFAKIPVLLVSDQGEEYEKTKLFPESKHFLLRLENALWNIPEVMYYTF